jgi:nitrogen-specific signal transduction histidine kinase
MIREVDRVDKLIEQLLDLSRPAKLLTTVNIHEVLERFVVGDQAAEAEHDC